MPNGNEREEYDKNDDSRLDEWYGVPDNNPNLLVIAGVAGGIIATLLGVLYVVNG